jgi:hypothetical protein
MKLLERVNEQIKQCEDQREKTPDYYDHYIKGHHELFITIKEELEAFEYTNYRR